MSYYTARKLAPNPEVEVVMEIPKMVMVMAFLPHANRMEVEMVIEIPHANRKELYGGGDSDRDGDGDKFT